jgi:hypothetical protein
MHKFVGSTAPDRPSSDIVKFFISYRSVKLSHFAGTFWALVLKIDSASIRLLFAAAFMAIKFYLHLLYIVNVIGLTR